MANSVDNRVVRMEFDNAAFEKRVKDTLTSLSQLDKALKLTGASKGLSDISAAAKRVDLTPIGTAVNTVSTGFLTLSTIAVTALATISHAAITSGAQLVKSLSLEPVLDGFREYELNIGSIQTILANTKADGTGLNDVNAALDQLNEYSDKTIYNFGQMTRNIGTFTAAGVDLDTSVQSIKGISNLAAISGSSAEQAATAMYQLSQAVSTGTLRLMDWNSVVNAGMGGEVFQKALFETGVAMGTITDAPVGTTFEEWTSAGNSFRDSLQEGWLTGEVLTNTLKGFTGEMTEAQLLSIGYTKEQAAEILELGKTGVEAATRIRTLSQLMNTVKETVASGWSESFRTVFGNFEEASDLFTNVNNAISNFVKHNAEARNELLAGWKELGGRDILIKALGNAFKALSEIIAPIQEAFRDIFPKTTAVRLLALTESFSEFTQALRPSEKTIENIKRIFTGLFSALDIGWTIVKEGVGFLKDLFLQVSGLGSGNILEFTADIADFFTEIREGLDRGQAIGRFFDDLARSVQGPIRYIKDLKEAALGLFDNFDSDQLDAVGVAAGRFGERFSTLGRIVERITALWEPLQGIFDRVTETIGEAAELIGNWFQELGQKLAEAMGPGDFDAVLDAFNVGLLAGIGALIAKFLSGGINFDVGNGLFSNISSAFEELTGVLNAMQTSIRADALLKIAGAVALLSVSVVALSLIDSAALTRALTAMAVGFAQLMGAFAILNTMSVGITSGATFGIIATGMILLSTAIVILSGAVAILGNMSWGDLIKGLTAVTVMLGVLTASAIILSKNAGSILLASVSLIAMSTAVSVLAGAVALFATMEWDTLAKGFAGVTAGLLILAGTMRLMPQDLALRGVGLILIATALNILAGAVALFATMEWDTLIKGFAGVAAGLTIIGLAMHLFPPNMVLTAAGLLIVSAALNVMALAIKQLGGMSGEEIAKGLIALAGALLVIVVATNAMSGALGGAAAMLVVSAALAVLAGVLIALSRVEFGDLLTAIGAIALALTVFGVAATLLTPVVPVLIGLGVAMLALGAAFALFGVGALAVAKAFALLGEAGPEAAKAFTKALESIGKALPAILKGFGEGLVEIIEVIGRAAPVIAKALGVLLEHIIDTLIDLLPKVGELILVLIETILDILREAVPDIIDAGVELIGALLTGLRDNIYQITELAIEIVVEFLNAIADNIDQVIEAGVGIVIAFIGGIAEAHLEIAAAGTAALVAFLLGMTNNVSMVIVAAETLVVTFIRQITNSGERIATAGANSIIKFVEGLGRNASRVVTAGVNVIINFLSGVASNAIRLANAAADIIIGFLNALAQVIEEKAPQLRAAGLRVAKAIIDGISFGLASKAESLASQAQGIAAGIENGFKRALGIHSPSTVFEEFGRNIAEGLALGLDRDTSAERSALALANRTARVVNETIATAISAIEDMPETNPTITPVLDLTQIENGARVMGSMMETRRFSPEVSFRAANAIASTSTPIDDDISGSSGPSVVKFEQTINAPTRLSTSEIYRNTRNQITLAKEELNVA